MDPGLLTEPPVTPVPVPRWENTSPNTDLPEGEPQWQRLHRWTYLPSTVPELSSEEPATVPAALPDIPKATPVSGGSAASIAGIVKMIL